MKDTRPEFIVGNVLDVLANDFEDDSVDLVPTSPPYWGLRDYGSGTDAIWGGDGECVHDFTIGDEIEAKKIPPTYDGEWERPSREEYKKAGTDTKCLVCGKDFVGEMGQKFCSTKCLNTLSNKDRQEMAPLKQFCNNCGAWKGQLGLEPTWQLYVEHLVIISREIKRILKPTGSYYLVLGDTYAGGGGNTRDFTCGPKGFQKSNERLPTGRSITQRTGYDNITKPKQKLLLPFSVARGLQEDGWICRNDITWHKPNNMPGPWKDRLTNTTETIFHMVNNSKTLIPQKPSSTWSITQRRFFGRIEKLANG
jgi:DNA modification methylase